MIEEGRYKKIEKNKRFCPFCPEKIENEIHFLFDCPVYKNIRTEFNELISTQNHNFSDGQRLDFVLGKKTGCNDVAKFISKLFDKRKDILNPTEDT